MHSERKEARKQWLFRAGTVNDPQSALAGAFRKNREIDKRDYRTVRKEEQHCLDYPYRKMNISWWEKM